MKKHIIVTALAATLLAGCQEKPQYTCDNDEVIEKVIALQTKSFNDRMSQPGMKQGMFNAIVRIAGDRVTIDEDHHNIAFKLNAIRTVNQNKELGNYECKALLYAEKGTEKSEGIEITYTSEAINNGKDTYVQTQLINNTQVGHLAAVLVKVKEFPEMTARGPIDYGSLDSAVGDLSFATQSDVGHAIFDKCDVTADCEVKAKVEKTKFGYIIREVISARKIN